MNLDRKHIKKKEVIGKLRQQPVYLVETKGGLHLVFANSSRGYEPIGTGPHKAVALWMAEKREPDVQWLSLRKSEETFSAEEVACILTLTLARLAERHAKA